MWVNFKNPFGVIGSDNLGNVFQQNGKAGSEEQDIDHDLAQLRT